MRRRLAALALGSVLVLHGCGPGDDAEELRTRVETTIPSTTTSSTSSSSTTTTTTSSTTTTVAPTAPTRPPATRPPATTPVAEQPASGDCSPAYPDFCIPPAPPDLDCPDVGRKGFTVLPPDPHRFDADSDGIGCER